MFASVQLGLATASQIINFFLSPVLINHAYSQSMIVACSQQVSIWGMNSSLDKNLIEQINIGGFATLKFLTMIITLLVFDFLSWYLIILQHLAP